MKTNIKNLIAKAEQENRELSELPAKLEIRQAEIDYVPTLQPEFYRSASPMLKERFSNFGHWENATHGDWLSIDEMKELWKDKTSSYMENIRSSIKACAEEWPNDAAGLFKDNRISVFAADENGYERIYLIWFDEVEEPEVWVYDCNGRARYMNLAFYLQAYLEDDLSAYDEHCLLEDSM